MIHPSPGVEEWWSTARMAGPTLLGGYEAHLRERCTGGCTNTALLIREITEQGYWGSAQTVRRFLQLLRTDVCARPSWPQTPSIRQVTVWLTCHPNDLTTEDSARLAYICDRSPALTTVREHARGFAGIMVECRGHDLTEEVAAVATIGSRALWPFVAGLR